jgi:alkanesulfonate monooxygenase SsuD/methylene tetrahydromethanopterin reductase-like flavin-dependent oxidoreductase (luciferase family)
LSAADVDTVRDAAAQVERVVDGTLEVSARVFVVPGEDSGAEVAARRHIAGYLTVPVYAEFQRWLGRASALEPMWAAWSAGDRKGATAAIPDDVINDIVITGSPKACAEGVRAYMERGLDAVTIALMPPHGAEFGVEQQVEFLAQLGAEL